MNNLVVTDDDAGDLLAQSRITVGEFLGTLFRYLLRCSLIVSYAVWNGIAVSLARIFRRPAPFVPNTAFCF